MYVKKQPMVYFIEEHNYQMDVNECHRTFFRLRIFSVCKSSFSFLMFYGGTRQSSGRSVNKY